MRDNWPKIAAKVPAPFLPFFANTGGGCSAERLAIARTFFTDPSRNLPGMEKQLTKVADQVNDCVGLRGREGAAVVAYLRGLSTAN